MTKAEQPDERFVKAGPRMRAARKRLRLSQRDMARRLGLHWNTVARVERGDLAIRRSFLELAELLADKATK